MTICLCIDDNISLYLWKYFSVMLTLFLKCFLVSGTIFLVMFQCFLRHASVNNTNYSGFASKLQRIFFALLQRHVKSTSALQCMCHKLKCSPTALESRSMNRTTLQWTSLYHVLNWLNNISKPFILLVVVTCIQIFQKFIFQNHLFKLKFMDAVSFTP